MYSCWETVQQPATASAAEQKDSSSFWILGHWVTSVRFVLLGILSNSSGNCECRAQVTYWQCSAMGSTSWQTSTSQELKRSQASVIKLCNRQLTFLTRGILKISQEFSLYLNAFCKHMFIHNHRFSHCSQLDKVLKKTLSFSHWLCCVSPPHLFCLPLESIQL